MIFYTNFADANQKINFLKNMVMSGGFLVLSATAPVDVKAWTSMQIKRKESASLSVSAEAESFLKRAGLMEKGESATADAQSITKAKREVTTLLQGYRNALIESDTEAVMKLYAFESMLMAQNFPSVVGWDDIKTRYAKCFERLALDVAFDVKEVVVTSGEYAFASTTSSGTQKDRDTGAVSREGNHELFVIRKEKGDWDLARCCFSTTNPAE